MNRMQVYTRGLPGCAYTISLQFSSFTSFQLDHKTQKPEMTCHTAVARVPPLPGIHLPVDTKTWNSYSHPPGVPQGQTKGAGGSLFPLSTRNGSCTLDGPEHGEAQSSMGHNSLPRAVNSISLLAVREGRNPIQFSLELRAHSDSFLLLWSGNEFCSVFHLGAYYAIA